MRRAGTRALLVASVCTVIATTGLSAAAASDHSPPWPADVWAIGNFNGVPGNFGNTSKPGLAPQNSTNNDVATIQAAVDAAEAWAQANTPTSGPDDGVVPDTYVLLAPGDYKTDPTAIPAGPAGQDPGAVLINTDNVWLVGMNRNSVVVDGTRSGPPCSPNEADQVFGPSTVPNEGLNGVMVWKAAGTWVENLTACNFLDGTGGDGGTGNEIWWNGGAGTGTVYVDNQGGYVGDYITATSTYYPGEDPKTGVSTQLGSDAESLAAAYGIFSSDWDGGVWDHSYASNFNDSGYYIGACQDECNQTVNHAWAEYNALGYSGSNSGGVLLVEHSQFDNNEDGFDTNSQNGDNPSPQNGACPPGVNPPIAGAQTCWVFYDNYSHDNNDANVPTYGSAAAGPVGTGMSLSGARDDTVMDNLFENNDAWGDILVPYPDSGPPCTGGTQLKAACIFDESGDAVTHNRYVHNGSFGNPTNGDIAATNLEPGPTDCFSANTDANGNVTTSPPDAESRYPDCTGMTVPPDANALFTDEVACDSGSISIGPVKGESLCPAGANYPRQSEVVMHPLPGASLLTAPSSTSLSTMPDPCGGDPDIAGSSLPASPWCPTS